MLKNKLNEKLKTPNVSLDDLNKHVIERNNLLTKISDGLKSTTKKIYYATTIQKLKDDLINFKTGPVEKGFFSKDLGVEYINHITELLNIISYVVEKETNITSKINQKYGKDTLISLYKILNNERNIFFNTVCTKLKGFNIESITNLNIINKIRVEDSIKLGKEERDKNSLESIESEKQKLHILAFGQTNISLDEDNDSGTVTLIKEGNDELDSLRGQMSTGLLSSGKLEKVRKPMLANEEEFTLIYNKGDDNFRFKGWYKAIVITNKKNEIKDIKMTNELLSKQTKYSSKFGFENIGIIANVIELNEDEKELVRSNKELQRKEAEELQRKKDEKIRIRNQNYLDVVEKLAASCGRLSKQINNGRDLVENYTNFMSLYNSIDSKKLNGKNYTGDKQLILNKLPIIKTLTKRIKNIVNTNKDYVNKQLKKTNTSIKIKMNDHINQVCDSINDVVDSMINSLT